MFTRQPYTIPAAGEFLKIDAKGQAVIIENMPVYDTPEDVPLFHYNSRSNRDQAMFPQSSYGYDPCDEFQSIYIQGTEASAGDTVYLWINDHYVETKINIVFTSQFSTIPGTTFTKTANDVAQSLSELELIKDGELPSKIYISVSPSAGNDGIRWAIDTDPVQGNDTLGHLLTPDMGVYEIKEIAWILAFRFIAVNNAVPQTLNITPEY